MMKNYAKRIIALILSITMLFTMSSLTVFSEGGEQTDEISIEQYEEDALNVGDEPNELTLDQSDVEETQPTDVSESLTALTPMNVALPPDYDESLYLKITGQLFEEVGANYFPPPEDRIGVADAEVTFVINAEQIGQPILTDENGYFEIYVLKTLIDLEDETTRVHFQPIKRGYSNVGCSVHVSDLVREGFHWDMPIRKGGVISGTFSSGHLPAADNGYRFKYIYVYQKVFDEWRKTTATKLVTEWFDDYEFAYLEPGEYKIGFADVDSFDFGADDCFQFYNGALILDNAEVIVVEAGDEISGINSVTWDGDRDHASEDSILPYIVEFAPSGVDKPSSGNVVVTFNEEMQSAPGTIVLSAVGDEKTMATGSWSEGKVYTSSFSDLHAGRLYTATISGFKDIAGNIMRADSTHKFAIEGGQIQRELTVASGISVAGQITPDAALDSVPGAVHAQGADEACDAIHHAEGQGLLLAMHDITVSGGSFTGPLTITMPIPPQYNGRTVSVLHCKNGILETLTAVVINGKVTFQLDSLSPIGVVLPAGLPNGSDPIAFTDGNFKTALLQIAGIDANSDGKISYDEAAAVTELDVRGKEISDLSEIVYFTALQTLICRYNELETLDVSTLSQLVKLDCDNNMLTSLTVTGLTELDTLFCGDNRLQSIDVSGLTKLRLFACFNNRLSTIDMSGLNMLDAFQCNDNLFTTLDLTELTSLTRLYCKNNYLPSTSALIGYNAALTTILDFEPQNIGKPSAPTNLRTIAESGKVTLMWDMPDADGGSAVTGYEVCFNPTNDEFNWVPVASGTSFTFTGLTNGSMAAFLVRAINENGAGLYSFIVDSAVATSVASAVVTVVYSHQYTGSPIEPSGTGLKVDLDGVRLTENVDYTLTYENNTNASTSGAVVIVTGKGLYAGEVRKNFGIQKAAQAAPAAPTLGTKTATKVVLNWPDSNLNFRRGENGTWYYGATFINLEPNTTYTFYAMLGETVNYLPSLPSLPLTVTTDKAALSGTASITGTAKFGEVLMANTSGLSSTPPVTLGTLSYQWKRGSTPIGTNSSTYQLQQADIGQTITVTVTATNCVGTAESIATGVVSKADGPAAPTVSGAYSGNGATFTYTVTAIAGSEYRMDSGAWQNNNIFTSIAPLSSHIFSARIKETATHEAGTAGSTGSVTFAKLANSSVPTLNYDVTGAPGSKTITIHAVAGAEYQFGSDSWSATNTKTYTSDVTETIFIRYKATVTHNESAVASTTVNLANAEQPAPSAFTLTFALNSDGTTYTAMIPTVTGGEYSFDGVNYSGINKKIDCAANTSYTGYVRLAAKPGFNASSVTSDTKTTPMLAVATPVISGSYELSTPIITETLPNMPTVATASITGMVKDGVLTATITDKMAKDAITAAKTNINGIAVQFNLTANGNYHSFSVTLDRTALEALKTAGVKYVKMGSAVLDLTLDTKTIAGILAQTTGNINVSATKQGKISDSAKVLIGTRPVFDITIKDSKGKSVSDLKGGTATIGIPYTPKSTEKTGNLYGVYVDKNGNPQLLINSSYENGKVIFARNSLSVYGIGDKTPIPDFTDTTNHWAKGNIDFVASRSLITGTTPTTFSPDVAITRATFLMALGKLSGADVSGYKKSSFTDVKDTNPAMPYIEWAVKKGIVQGIGNNQFGHDQKITREQMAVMMVNYSKVTGYKLPVSRIAVTFADDAKISVYAKDAVKAIQQTSVISGKPNNLFDPQGNATRAEAATILRRFEELVIDEGTAHGWVQNDAVIIP